MCWSHLLSHTLRERGDGRLKPFLSHHPETPQAAIHAPVFKSLLHDVANESILCLTCLRIAPQGRNRSGNPEELLGSLVPSSHCIDGDTETQPGPHSEDPLSRAGSFAASGARLPGVGRAAGWRGGREEGERPARRFVHQTPRHRGEPAACEVPRMLGRPGLRRRSTCSRALGSGSLVAAAAVLRPGPTDTIPPLALQTFP